MNILHVDGLVSFAHRYKATQLEETARGASIAGTILDKIAGRIVSEGYRNTSGKRLEIIGQPQKDYYLGELMSSLK